ncbi:MULTISPECIES: hypothetical protein [Halomonas]|uniref:hypothetical protein n=1 Tax=Halomonas TaxID=2745 RepID=UPI000ED4FE86|nr:MULTISPECIES: hypothetical protein [Halomonas]HCR99163.1 hypothetical protein [Halomonas sp.]
MAARPKRNFSATGNDDRPVYIDNHPPIPHLKKREASSKIPSLTRKRANGKPHEHYFSWKLTYCMKALMQYQNSNRADGWKLAAITVNLPFLRSLALTSQKKGPATAYGDAIAGRLSYLHRQPRFFLTLEDSKDETLHAHICMAYHPDDQVTIRQALRLDAASNNASIMFRHEYRQYEPDPTQGDIDREMDEAREAARAAGIPDDEGEPEEPCSLYQLYDQRLNRYYRMMPIDIGWADYLSKELHQGGANFLVGKSGGQGRAYVQRGLIQAANTLHKNAREDFMKRKS